MTEAAVEPASEQPGSLAPVLKIEASATVAHADGSTDEGN